VSSRRLNTPALAGREVPPRTLLLTSQGSPSGYVPLVGPQSWRGSGIAQYLVSDAHSWLPPRASAVMMVPAAWSLNCEVIYVAPPCAGDAQQAIRSSQPVRPEACPAQASAPECRSLPF